MIFLDIKVQYILLVLIIVCIYGRVCVYMYIYYAKCRRQNKMYFIIIINFVFLNFC